MLDSWFTTPVFLVTLASVPIACALMLQAWYRRRRDLALLGSPVHLRKAIHMRTSVRRFKTLGTLAVLCLLAIACARPQWGIDPDPPQRTGRDVVLVLDLSRTMLAEQPSRRELALRALTHLANAFEADGGNRVALVIFAARAELLFPFTQDYEHLRQAVRQVALQEYPSLSDASSPSGTRIGTALQLALVACDEARANRPAIVLLSDGDDPAADDPDAPKEWLNATALARNKRVRIHTVGFGDPDQAHTIPVGKERLLFQNQPVLTRLREDRLREIAHHTGGVYMPARTQSYPLGTYVQHLLDTDADHAAEPHAGALPVLQQQYAWFLVPAVVLFLVTLLLGESSLPRKTTMNQPNAARVSGNNATKRAVRTAALVVAALLSLSASNDTGARTLIQQGDAAFGRGEYQAALEYYEQAETLTLDPGVVAFNKGAAYHQLGQHRHAIESYRRSLDDDAMPSDRRARAWYNLGNALTQDARDDLVGLAQAAAAFRTCLRQSELDAKLREDARNNLEIVQQLWLQAKARQDESPGPKGKKPSPPPKEDEDAPWTKIERKKDHHVKEDAGAPAPGKTDKLVSKGAPQALRDTEAVQAIAVADTEATLDAAARRIAERRLAQRHPDGPTSLTTRDW